MSPLRLGPGAVDPGLRPGLLPGQQLGEGDGRATHSAGRPPRPLGNVGGARGGRSRALTKPFCGGLLGLTRLSGAPVGRSSRRRLDQGPAARGPGSVPSRSTSRRSPSVVRGVRSRLSTGIRGDIVPWWENPVAQRCESVIESSPTSWPGRTTNWRSSSRHFKSLGTDAARPKSEYGLNASESGGRPVESSYPPPTSACAPGNQTSVTFVYSGWIASQTGKGANLLRFSSSATASAISLMGGYESAL
jgi:hypothetical protein